MKSRDLNDLNILEIDTKLDENEEALQNLKFQKAMQQLEDPLKIKYLTKEIAQLEKLKKTEGALVASVSDGSPAAKGGIKAGDIILEFDGKKVDTMRTLPKLVAQTKVGKKVVVKIWRNQRLISKKILLGRLESSKEFKEENKIESDENIIIESLKISVRDLTKKDISQRELPKDITGVVITKISENSPLRFISVNDVIAELQKKKIKNSSQFSKLIKEILNKDQKTLLFAIYNSSNQRSYLTVKLN